jgi:hypothetical protein
VSRKLKARGRAWKTALIDFQPARVTTHAMNVDYQKTPKTVILIEFDPLVLEREKKYSL